MVNNLPLCCEFALRSNRVKSWMHRQSEVKEESLTDWLLDNLSSNLPGIFYKQFNRHEEARVTGADWEWWFVFADDRFFSMRIQAKKIHVGDNYSDIARTNKYGLQIDKLLEDAANGNHFPAYAFYSTNPYDKCCVASDSDEGIYIASAEIINEQFVANGKKKVAESDILPFCFALSKLLCARLAKREMIMDTQDEKVYEEVFRKRFSLIMGKSEDELLADDMQGFKYAAPDYVSDILNEQGLDSRPLVTVKGHQFSRCDKVLVTDLRNIRNALPF